jgi:hypothetical protein
MARITIYTGNTAKIPDFLKDAVKDSKGKVTIIETETENQTEIIVTHTSEEKHNFWTKLANLKGSFQGNMLMTLIISKITQ